MSKFKILNIRGIKDSKFGDVVMIIANPVEVSSWGATFFTPYECEKSKKFIVSEDDVQEYVRIAQSDELWEPDMDEFFEKKIHNQSTNRIETVYRHYSLYE